jgi:CBS domain-containing protein
MLDTSRKPFVSPDSSIKNVIVEISEKRLGVAAVIENNKVFYNELSKIVDKFDDSFTRMKNIMEVGNQ